MEIPNLYTHEIELLITGETTLLEKLAFTSLLNDIIVFESRVRGEDERGHTRHHVPTQSQPLPTHSPIDWL